MNAVVADGLAWCERGPAQAPSRAVTAFRELRDPREMFPAGGQQRTLEGLLRLADDGNAGCGLLTGAPGLGKTLLRVALQQQASADRCVVVALETGLLGFDDLLLEVLSQLRGERLTAEQLPGRYERLAEFKSALVSEVVAAGRHLLVLLDDADQTDAATLEAVGALSNLGSDRQSFVVPVFVGQPALRQKLARLPALRQRIGAQFVLTALDAAECGAYLAHRLRQVGLEAHSVFEPGLPARLHAASGGVPRVVDALCRHALRAAADGGRGTVTGADVERARSLLLEHGATLSPVLTGR